jgi:hypothetical protein
MLLPKKTFFLFILRRRRKIELKIVSFSSSSFFFGFFGLGILYVSSGCRHRFRRSTKQNEAEHI